MKLFLKILQKLGACSEGVKWYQDNGQPKTVELTAKILLASDNNNKLAWTNWLVSQMLTREDKIRYVIFAVEQVVDVYEKIYSEDKRPRHAINAAKAVLKNNNEKTRSAAWSAWIAAESAAESAAWSAAWISVLCAASTIQIKIINYGLSLIGGKK